MTKPLAIAACLSLLSLQFSGVHVHADESGYVGAPETSFSHSHSHDDHDAAAHHGGTRHDDHAANYEGARDVSVLDLALGLFKLPLALLALFLLFAIFPRVKTLAGTEIAYPVLSGRHTRWRPPLRAPPIPA